MNRNRGLGSALDGADHDALCEIFLEERIHDGDRDDGHHRRGHLDVFLGDEFRAVLSVGCRHGRGGKILDDQVPQHQLQRIFTRIVDEHHRVPPFIPVIHAVEQRERRDDRHGNRKDDPEQNLQIVGSIDPGGFLQCFRQTPEVILHDDQIPGKYGLGPIQTSGFCPSYVADQCRRLP